MENQPDLTSEHETGDQPFSYRKRRGAGRYPKWRDVQTWRDRWTADKVASALDLIRRGASAEEIGNATGFGTLKSKEDQDAGNSMADLRGIDVALLSPDKYQTTGQHGMLTIRGKDLSNARLEGSRLTGMVLSGTDLSRAQLQKSTLRRVTFVNANLTKAHLEDADLRETNLDRTRLGHIRYTEDGFWWRGTVLMETHLDKALYVDPLLERCAKDQYYLYVLKYRIRNNPVLRIFFFLWWVLCNFGKSPLIWAAWSVVFAMTFAGIYYYLGEEAFKMQSLTWSFSAMVYYSVVTFTTLGFGDVTPNTQQAAWWVMAEVIVGYVMLGGLISIFATKLARRS